MAKKANRRPHRDEKIDIAMSTSPRWLLWPLLAVAVLLVPTYFLLQKTYSDSWVVTAVNLTLGAVTGLWSIVLLIALSFDKREQFIERIRATYLSALRMQWLVGISLLLLASAEGLLIFELVGARSLAVPTEASVEVLLNDEPGKVVVLGKAKGGACDDVAPPTVRIPTGRHIIVFRSLASGQPVAFHKLDVPLFWNGALDPAPCVRREHEVHRLD